MLEQESLLAAAAAQEVGSAALRWTCWHSQRAPLQIERP